MPTFAAAMRAAVTIIIATLLPPFCHYFRLRYADFACCHCLPRHCCRRFSPASSPMLAAAVCHHIFRFFDIFRRYAILRY